MRNIRKNVNNWKTRKTLNSEWEEYSNLAAYPLVFGRNTAKSENYPMEGIGYYTADLTTATSATALGINLYPRKRHLSIVQLVVKVHKYK